MYMRAYIHPYVCRLESLCAACSRVAAQRRDGQGKHSVNASTLREQRLLAVNIGNKYALGVGLNLSIRYALCRTLSVKGHAREYVCYGGHSVMGNERLEHGTQSESRKGMTCLSLRRQVGSVIGMGTTMR
jgi:hypothetical protein